MAFAKTTWVDGGAPSISAAQLNRIENGIADLYAYKGASKRVDFNGTNWDLTGLDGDTHKGYDITAWGLYAATSAECATYLTKLAPAQTYTHSQGMYTGESNAATPSSTTTQGARDGTGVWLGSSYDQANGRNFVVVKLSVLAVQPSSGNNDILIQGQSMFRSVGRAAGTPGHFMGLIGGFIESGGGSLTGLRFNWDNAALVGSVIVEPWVGSF